MSKLLTSLQKSPEPFLAPAVKKKKSTSEQADEIRKGLAVVLKHQVRKEMDRVNG